MVEHERLPLKPEDSPKQPELPAMPERETRPGLDVVIAGGPGAGSTTAGNRTGASFGQSPATIKSRGYEFRQRAKSPVIGFVPRDPKIDRKLDRKTARNIGNTRPGQKKVIVAKIGPWVAVQEREKAVQEGRDFPNILTVLLYATLQKRAERITPRENAEWGLNLTVEEMKQRIVEREQGDLRTFWIAHPELKGINPLDPNDPWVKKNVDLIIDTSELSEEEVEFCILDELLKRNYISPQDIHRRNGKSETHKPEPVSQAQIFPAS